MDETSRIVAVTDLDRDAASAAYYDCYDEPPNALWMAKMEDGGHDEDCLVQAFARHREQATASLRAHLLSDEVVERAAKNVQLHLDGFENDPRVIARAALSSALGEG